MWQWFSTNRSTLVFLALILIFSCFSPKLSQAAQATLTWDANSPAPDGYCIYSRAEGRAYDYSQPCWTGTGTTGTVDRLEDNITHYFVVRAYVAARESADSEEVKFINSKSSDILVEAESEGRQVPEEPPDSIKVPLNIAGDNTVRIWIEGEDGDLQFPMEIADDKNAGAGGYIWVPPGNGNFSSPSEEAGYAEYNFNVPEAGDYLIWGRQMSNDANSNSFFVSIDGLAEMAWHTNLGGQDVWNWNSVSLGTATPERFRLAAGAHTLRIKQGEDGTKLDRLLITNEPNVDFYDLMVSYSPDRSGAVMLDGASVEGNIYAYAAPIAGIKKVEFFIDGVLRQTENIAPYDLAGGADSGRAAPFDTGKLSQGAHTFSARITKTDGSRETITADVYIDGPKAAGSTYKQWVSASSNRSNPDALDGAAVDGKIYVFVAPISGIKRVEFFIDGVLRQTENIAPYDLAGGAGSGRAAPFDTGKLSQGSHTFSARITKTDGSRETITANASVQNLSN